MKKKNDLAYADNFLFSIFIVFLASIVFSWRAVSSLAIGLILLLAIVRGVKLSGNSSHQKNSILFLVGCGLLLVLQCISLFYTNNVAEGLKLLQRSSGILIIPLAVFCNSSFLTHERFRKLMLCFAVILSLGGLYCLIVSTVKYFHGAPVYTFFYHDLVKPLSQHAIQFSIMVFIALVFLVENLNSSFKYFPRSVLYSLLGFLSLFLILLSSKLVICFYMLYLLSFFFYNSIYKKISFVYLFFAVGLIAVILIPNPVSNRFRSMFEGNALLFEQSKFDPGIRFNGVQFRLLQWRFTYEILSGQKAWVRGVTPGDAQSFLDKKYVETKMYTGIPGTQKRGFLGYHTHNQFLQSLLENGLPALAIFIFISFLLCKMAVDRNANELKWLVTLLLIYCFTDAPLETQYGIIIFTFFPALLYAGCKKASKSVLPSKDLHSLNFHHDYQAGNPIEF